MNLELKGIKQKTLALPVKDWAEFAERLLESLHDPSALEIEAMWVEKAEKRYQAYLQGAVLQDLQLRRFKKLKNSTYKMPMLLACNVNGPLSVERRK